ncbi:MAG TPA: polyphosphate kinase 1, partial [Gemmatimonadaceae bacterium]
MDDPTPPRRFEASVDSADARAALLGTSEPARRIAAVVDPRLLETKLELQIERIERSLDETLLGRARIHLFYDRVHVRTASSSRAFHQVTVRTSRSRDRLFDQICSDMEEGNGLRPIAAGTRERAQLLLKWLEREERGRATLADAAVVLALTRGGQLALFARDGLLSLPFERGSGVGCARTLLDRYVRGSALDARLVGKVSAIGPSPALEVWSAEIDTPDLSTDVGSATWEPMSAVLAHANQLHPDALAALSIVQRAGLLATSDGAIEAGQGPRRSRLSMSVNADLVGPDGDASDSLMLNAEASILAFIARVLEMAEDLRTPLAERLRFLAIVAENLDEVFMVRVAGTKRSAIEQAEERSADGLTPRQQLALISLHARSLIARLYRCYDAVAAEAAAHGGRLVEWSELDETQRTELREYLSDELLASLTPLAMTLSPGHPFPRVRHLSLSLAVVFLDRPGSTPHFAQVELPEDTPRLIPVPGSDTVITAEELVRANLDMLYPSSVVEQAYAFRVTRGADLDIEEDQAPSLLKAVEEASKRRFEQPVVRVEVERAMPAVLRDVVMRELRRENGGAGLEPDDMYEIDGPLDLRCLHELKLTGERSLSFPRFDPADPFPSDRTMFSLIDDGDRLCHHPFDSFDATVVRLLKEAANDPDVTAIKMTIYRAGDSSPIVAALVAAAESGKDVVAFVELKARFDEERNVAWARRLEDAGGRVVHGLVGIKTHAKVALIVRRDESHRLRRYVHVGTGNYNTVTGRRYTDLSLFTSDETITADVQDLFNELTGRAHAPLGLTRGCLLSPRQLLPELLSRIEREAALARSGRGGSIRMKLNGLSDPELVEAIHRAASDGVRVELIVRGICTLRPAGDIRIVSVLGRFLEHSRVFHFANAGSPEYFIGSADLRPRNLRRRVELLVPVKGEEC